jgi:REP element-mobilizing transposase RayT
MASARREWIDGGIYHVYSRGSNRQAIFLNDGDYTEFETLFATVVGKHGLDCYGWSFMPNHWHGIFRSSGRGLSQFMQQLNQRYALRFDRRWRRTAHVFEARFGAVLQETEEQFLWTLRYLVRNPVEAGICASPFDARWTSFSATAGLVRAPTFLRASEILERFGRDPDEARRRYVEYVVAEPRGQDTATSAELPERLAALV